MKVLLSQMVDLCVFNLVEHKHAPSKGKAIATNGELGVYSLLKMDIVISRRF